jgi:hypothetical protein
MSKLNFNATVTINELRKVIPLIGSEITPIIVSEPGCGKTSILTMMEADHGDKYDYIYVDCPVKDMSDVGMTIPNHGSKSLEYYVSSLFKLDSPKPKVILLDEFMKAPKLLQVIFTRLMLERMVGDVPLPSGSIVFGTSNNASDGVGDTMLAHAGNRVCIMEMSKPSVNDWLEWASAKGISRVVRAFVALFPRTLASYRDGNQDDNPYVFNPKKTQLSFCSPRSLAKCDVIVRNRDTLGENATMVALAGTIGLAGAGDMSAFLSLEKTLMDVKDIVKDPEGVKVPDEVSAQLMIMFQAVDVLETQDELNKFMKFVNKIPSSEVQAVFFTMMMRNTKATKLARHNLQIAEWAKNNHELF